MTKKVPKKILRIERNFFVNLRKKCFWPPTPRRRRRRFFGPAARRRRRDNDVGAQLYFHCIAMVTLNQLFARDGMHTISGTPGVA